MDPPDLPPPGGIDPGSTGEFLTPEPSTRAAPPRGFFSLSLLFYFFIMRFSLNSASLHMEHRTHTAVQGSVTDASPLSRPHLSHITGHSLHDGTHTTDPLTALTNLGARLLKP